MLDSLLSINGEPMMKTINKKTAIGAALSALFTLSAAGNVYADAYTFSYSLVDLSIYNVTADRPADVGDFFSLTARNTAAANADLLSVSGAANNNSLTTADVAPTYQILGGGSFANNDATQHTSGMHFARSDTSATGSAITGTGSPIPATVGVWSEILLTSSDMAQSSANANNNTGFDFTLEDGATFRFDLSASTYTQSFLSADAITPPSIVGSNATWTLELLKSGTSICNWSPDGQAGGISGLCTELNDSIDLTFGSTVSTPGADTGLIWNTGSAQAQITLDPGSYTFRLTQTSSADATLQVPEPGTLFLLGVGLLGIFTAGRRFNIA